MKTQLHECPQCKSHMKEQDSFLVCNCGYKRVSKSEGIEKKATDPIIPIRKKRGVVGE